MLLRSASLALSSDDTEEEEGKAFIWEGGAVIIEVEFEWVEKAEAETEVWEQSDMILWP